MLAGTLTDDSAARARRAGRLELLVADDDEAARAFYVTVLEEIDGVRSVAAAADGVEAVQLAQAAKLDVAVLDLNMPRLDGVEAALELAALEPAPAIALHSSDPNELRRRANGLGLALFGKLEFDRLVAWVEDEVAYRRGLPLPPPRQTKRDLTCARCGYGVATYPPPLHCPMCNSAGDWVGASNGRAR